MRFIQFVLAAALVAVPYVQALQPRAACNRDDCFRQVAGTNGKIASEQRRADCSAFQATTITPPATTVTTTVTPTAAPIDKRAAVVPVYASFCKSPSAYASACSCAGIAATTVTAIASTVTETVTATASPTEIFLPPFSCFALQAGDEPLTTNEFVVVGDSEPIPIYVRDDATIDTASVFSLDGDSDGHLYYQRRVAYTAQNEKVLFSLVPPSEPLARCTLASTADAAGRREITCTILAGPRYFTLQMTDPVVYLTLGNFASSFRLYAVSVPCSRKQSP